MNNKTVVASDCGIRAVICFLNYKNVLPAEIHRIYVGNSSLSSAKRDENTKPMQSAIFGKCVVTIWLWIIREEKVFVLNFSFLTTPIFKSQNFLRSDVAYSALIFASIQWWQFRTHNYVVNIFFFLVVVYFI